MVACDRKDVAALRLLRRLQNHEVGDIAEGHDQISRLCGEVMSNPIVIGERQKVHGLSGHKGRGASVGA